MPPLPALLVAYRPDLLDQLVQRWRASFEFGVGITDPHPLAEQRQYFVDQVLPHNELRVALVAGEQVGFVAASRDSVAQLHVAVGWHRRGIGSLMLDWAKAQSGGSLWLYTFARNAVARAFYEHHGFVIEAEGFEPVSQLADVKYQWCARPSSQPTSSGKGG